MNEPPCLFGGPLPFGLESHCPAAEPDRKASVSVLYARFLAVDCQDEAAAREVYSAALSRHPSQRFLWEAAIHFEEYSDATGRSGEQSWVSSFFQLCSCLPFHVCSCGKEATSLTWSELKI